MSENDYQPQQERPSRTSSSPTRRTTPTRRAYTTNRRTAAGGSAPRDSGTRRASDDYTARRASASEPRSTNSEGESMATEMIGSLKDAVSSGRDAISSRVSSFGEQGEGGAGGLGDGPLQGIMDKIPSDNVWVKRGILIVAALLIVLILANLVTCAAGALGGGASKATSSAASGASSQAASSQASSATAKQGVASPWTDDGTFSTGDSALDAYIKDLCDKHSTDGASYEDNAYDTYIYVSRTDYVERENNQSPWGPTWDIEYAKQYFEEGDSGNCYNYAAVVEYVLKYFGYSDAEAEPCVVALESGAWGDHGLVFVTNKKNNKRCIIDSSLSANGWMLDADSYQYDIRNINQNSTIQGNVDVLGDNDTPTRIPAGELTESESNSSASSASAQSEDTDAGAENADENVDEGLTEENADEEAYYEEGSDEEASYDDGSEEEVYYDDGSEEEVYYEETYDEGEGEYYEEGGEEEVYYEEEG